MVSSGVIVAGVIDQRDFKIEAQLPEADLPKVKVGDKTAFTLDAYGNDLVLSATITAIDPAEKIIDGVSTYKITAESNQYENKVRSGMTANLTIKTAEKDNVLVLPQRAITFKDGERTVKLLTAGGALSEKKIRTGLRGSDGNIEIVAGLAEGDKVLNSAK